MKTPVSTGMPVGRVAVLGIITIAVYGSWYYSFGVLLDPIIEDTGWAESSLTVVYSASILAGGLASLGGGLLLDRFGSRLVFSLSSLVGLMAFQVAASADSLLLFGVMGAVGGASFSALGFYHITQTVAVRISPGAADRAIAVLTMWGALASAIYLPTAAWLVERIGWRTTVRSLTTSAVLALAVGAVLVTTRTTDMPRSREVIRVLRDSFQSRVNRRYVVAVAMMGVGVETILVYQVPAMTAAGLSLAAASFWAGFRGFAQLGGRLPLTPIVNRLGTVGAQRLAIVSTSIGMVILAFAGSIPLAATFAVLAGFGIGAMSPLQGMHARSIFSETSLGGAMGFLSLVFLVGGSMGPAAAGFLATASGSRVVPVLASAVVILGAIAFIRPAAEGGISQRK